PSCPWIMSIGALVSLSSFPTPRRKARSGSPAARASLRLPGWARLEDRAQGRRAFGEIASLLLRDGNAPRRAADRHRFDNVKRRHVDHRDVVAVAVGGE